jgi:aminopeptidase N
MNRLWLWLTILAISGQTLSCAPLDKLRLASAPAFDPLQVCGPSLQAWAQPQLETVGPLPRYTVQAELDPSGDRLEGQLAAVVPNTGSVPWPDLVFRLYPNLPRYEAAMSVAQIQLDGRQVAHEFDVEGSALRLLLPEPLDPGEEVTVTMAFSVDVPRRAEGYTLFGWEDGILSLPGFYPALAVHYKAAGSDVDSWATDVPPLFADVLFNPVALYDLRFSAPAALTVVASGTTLETETEQDGQKTWHIVGGPLRDMTVLVSDRWQSLSDVAAGATVTSYYLTGADAAGQAALFHAAAALRLYSDLYGDYPYTEFDVVAAPLGVRGMEYSGLVSIGQDLYSHQRERLAFLVAHETAHQWWYVQVGNDPLAYPWLDEGPAEYAAFDYYRGIYGQTAAESLLSERWQTPYAVATNRGIDGPVDQAASAMTADNYELLTYAKAALFFDALRGRLGDEMYTQVVRAYMETYRWQTVTPQHFLGLAQTLSGTDLNPLAEEWLR